LLETKYSNLSHNYLVNIGNSDKGNLKQYFKINGLIKELLSDLSKKGYMHKYSEDDVYYVIDNSSILAVDMAFHPETKYKAKPDYKFYRLCSFYDENTPSLVLYDCHPSSFKCYGCGYSGNIINYINANIDINFTGAIETLAMAFSIELPERKKTNIDKELVEKILRVLKSDYYNELLNISREKSKENNIMEKITYISLDNISVKKLNRRDEGKHIDYSGDLPF
jgi:hypothetical protein